MNLREWSLRYVPAEIACSITAMLCAAIAFHYTNSMGVAAVAGTWGENIGYYGSIILRDMRQMPLDLKYMRSLIIEFGFAEMLDTFLIRPFTMYVFPVLLGNLALGIVVGKIVADIAFYIPTVIGYELSQRIPGRS